MMLVKFSTSKGPVAIEAGYIGKVTIHESGDVALVVNGLRHGGYSEEYRVEDDLEKVLLAINQAKLLSNPYYNSQYQSSGSVNNGAGLSEMIPYVAFGAMIGGLS